LPLPICHSRVYASPNPQEPCMSFFPDPDAVARYAEGPVRLVPGSMACNA